jgi:hypothetical protein
MAQLRLFPKSLEDDDDNRAQRPTIRVSLSDLLPLITVARRHNYLWLQDFLDDEVCITPDLYEILRAFQSQRRA